MAVACLAGLLSVACPGEYEVNSGDGPLPMAIFELLEYIVNEVGEASVYVCNRCISDFSLSSVLVIFAMFYFLRRVLHFYFYERLRAVFAAV